VSPLKQKTEEMLKWLMVNATNVVIVYLSIRKQENILSIVHHVTERKTI